MTNIKKNLSLILGISIPIIMVALVAISIYLPAMFVKPAYDFVYVMGDTGYGGLRYSVEDGKITKLESKPAAVPDYYPQQSTAMLYRYEVKNDASRQITFEEAQGLHLNSASKSRDGFEVVSGDSGRFAFFGSGNDYGSYFLKGQGVSKKISVNTRSTLPYTFRLLGWVE